MNAIVDANPAPSLPTTGRQPVIDRLLPEVYDRLRRLAHRHLAGQGAHTLSTTALVHETWLDLAARDGIAWQDRGHFLGYAAMAMRHILVDHARRKGAQKRGGGLVPLDLQAEAIPVEQVADQVVALDGALNQLAEVDARLVRVVELRFFAGLSVEETGELLGITPRTVVRDWQKARLFLHAAIGQVA
ncbi:ECF-type sigma factor [Dokdonella sp. MW10]|uniref:ECF-type sigma factor n=1 Tax=Dokdonella sp. MW10 TaxID=2992926 RepID=UPI003F7FFD25